MAYVKNLKGTSDNILPKDVKSWTEFWEKKKGYKLPKCGVLGCNNSDTVGGHVKIVGLSAKQYIVPLCKTCNNVHNEEEFEVFDGYMVPVVDD